MLPSQAENPSCARKSGPRSLIAISHGELDQYEGYWVQDEHAGGEGFLDEREDISWMHDEDQCYWIPGQVPEERRKPKGGKGSSSRRFFRSCRKGGGKGKKSADSSSAEKANIAKEEEEEEEEVEEEMLLADKRKRRGVRVQRRRARPQPTASATREADGIDEDSFGYSGVFLPAHMASPGEEWCLKGTKEAASEGSDGAVMILDVGSLRLVATVLTNCTKEGSWSDCSTLL